MMEELRVIVSGRVQLVMMRDFVQRTARNLGLTGYVKNLPDRTVEIVAQGERDALERLVGLLHKGSLLSRVDNVALEWRQAATMYESFEIEY